MKQLLFILLFLPMLAIGQTNLLPEVAWRTNVAEVERLTDTTYRFKIMPLDWNEPGASRLDYGNYFQDYAGNKYTVIDSAYLLVTVWDEFQTGVSPQVGRVGMMYQSPDSSKYLAPVSYKYLDGSALDNARGIELAYLSERISVNTDNIFKTSTQVFYAAQSQTTFTLNNNVEENISVSQNGVILPTTTYSISGSTLTLNIFAYENDRIQITYKY